MLQHYRTIAKAACVEIVEKKSRFIGHAKPVETEEEALFFIETCRQQHKTANHNCFAYQIGQNNQWKRYSDDGEPSSTAGVPMLSVLETEQIQFAVVVVTRYFGGTLLGTGGLVRAYQKATKEALLSATIIEKHLFWHIVLTTDYQQMGRVKHFLMQNNHIVENILYEDNIIFNVLVLETKLQHTLNQLTELTAGTIGILQKQTCYSNLNN